MPEAGLKNLVLPKAADDKLKERVADMKLRAGEFKQRALICSQLHQEEALQLLQESFGVQMQVVELQRQAAELQNQGLAAQSGMQQDVEHIKSQLQDVKTQLQRLDSLRDVVSRFESSKKLPLNKLPAQYAYINLFIDGVVVRSKRQRDSKTGHVGNPPTSLAVPSTTNSSMSGLTTTSILTLFQYEPDLLPTDLHAVLKAQQGPTQYSPERVGSIAKSPQLLAFLSTDAPTALVINGHGNPTPRSESTLVSARLMSSILDVVGAQQFETTIVPVGFFCGEHRHLSQDVHATPAEATMSLLLQVVAGWGRFNSSELEWVRENLNPVDVWSVRSVFEGLVRRLPTGVVVFVIVDGLDFFSEPAERVAEMSEVVRMLVGLSRAEVDVKARVKVLLVGATRARFAEEQVRETEVLHVPRFCPPTGDPEVAFGMSPGQGGQGFSGMGMLEY